MTGSINYFFSWYSMDKIKQLLLHSSPLALGIILSYLFWRNNYLLLALYLLVVLLVILFGKDKKIESQIFAYGVVWGFVIEIVGTQISGYQSFTNPDWMGVPLWLPVSWGYGFILIKRVALII